MSFVLFTELISMYHLSLEAHLVGTEVSFLLVWIFHFFNRDLYLVEININTSLRQIYVRYIAASYVLHCGVRSCRLLPNYN
jgi:hypothetical protein